MQRTHWEQRGDCGTVRQANNVVSLDGFSKVRSGSTLLDSCAALSALRGIALPQGPAHPCSYSTIKDLHYW